MSWCYWNTCAHVGASIRADLHCWSVTDMCVCVLIFFFFFRAPWSGTARCRLGRWMVRQGLWKVVVHALCRLHQWEVLTVTGPRAHRTYCNTEEKHEHRHLNQIQAIKVFMTGRKSHFKCKGQSVCSLFDLIWFCFSLSLCINEW